MWLYFCKVKNLAFCKDLFLANQSTQGVKHLFSKQIIQFAVDLECLCVYVLTCLVCQSTYVFWCFMCLRIHMSFLLAVLKYFMKQRVCVLDALDCLNCFTFQNLSSKNSYIERFICSFNLSMLFIYTHFIKSAQPKPILLKYPQKHPQNPFY